MEKVLTLVCAIIGTLLCVMALQTLIPNGLWLYLIALVCGTQLIVMAIRCTLRE